MDSYDKFVRKHCCKLSDADKLRSGFMNKGQMKDALYQYKSESLQKDFGGIDMTRKSLTSLAIKILQPELEPIETKSISLPTNYAHRPQPLTIRIIPSEAEISVARDNISARINIDQEIAEAEQELEGIKKDKSGSSSGASGPVSDRERFLEDQLIRNRVTQKALIEREEMALGELDEAEESAKKLTRQNARERETSVRGARPKQLGDFINRNWDKGIKIKDLMALLPKEERKSRSSLVNDGGKAEFLLDILEIDLDVLYDGTVGLDNLLRQEPPPVQPVFEETVEETVVESPELQRQPSLTDPLTMPQLTETQQRMVDMADEEAD